MILSLAGDPVYNKPVFDVQVSSRSGARLYQALAIDWTASVSCAWVSGRLQAGCKLQRVLGRRGGNVR